MLRCKETVATEGRLDRAEMEELLNMGVFDPSMSPWAACNVFVKKKYGSLHVTSDSCELNALTVADTYPIKDLQTTIQWMGTKRIF